MVVKARGNEGTNSVGHEKKGVSSVNSTRLDLSDDDGSEIVVLLRDGEHERSVDLPIGSGHAVEELEEGGRPDAEGEKVSDERRVEKGRIRTEKRLTCSKGRPPS